jgi:hypothetical protein
VSRPGLVALVLLASPALPAEPAPAATVRPLTKAEAAGMTGVSWRPGCPVPLAELRVVDVPYRDFAGTLRRGNLVVHRRSAARIGRVFVELLGHDFRIERLEPIDAFGGDDARSMAANNTSAFNCRPRTGGGGWSRHSWGEAIDLNPLQNPYVSASGEVLPPESRRFLDRAVAAPGLISESGPVVRAFERIGWKWGGRWRRTKDFQHFSRDGR